MNAFMAITANASPLHYAANIVTVGIFQKTKVLCFLSFEFVSYFDIRISNLVSAKGLAKPFVVKLFLAAYGIDPWNFLRCRSTRRPANCRLPTADL
jgi:hypothetical protein